MTHIAIQEALNVKSSSGWSMSATSNTALDHRLIVLSSSTTTKFRLGVTESAISHPPLRPLWVISGHGKAHTGCLLYPQKRTCSPPTIDVRLVPLADTAASVDAPFSALRDDLLHRTSSILISCRHGPLLSASLSVM
jgi:hypothetical protein